MPQLCVVSPHAEPKLKQLMPVTDSSAVAIQKSWDEDSVALDKFEMNLPELSDLKSRSAFTIHVMIAVQ